MTPSEDRVLNKLREEIARIVDPEVFAYIDARQSGNDEHEAIADFRWSDSLAKADQIIAAWNRRADPLVEELRGALIQGAEWFEEYADHHQAKGALDKASRNLERANYLRRREALALPVGGGSACTNLGGEEPDGSFAGEAQRKSEWVRTADRLPAYDRRVLVLTQMGRVFKAYLASGAAETDEGPCDQWIADDEDVCPPCWSDGACWSSNADEEPSDQPVAWAAIPEEVSNVVGWAGRPCTCHPDERPTPCQRKYALTDCLAALPHPDTSRHVDGAGWETIDSAPRDGTRVDLWCRAPGISAGPARVPDCWYSIGKWWCYDDYGDDQCRSEVRNATHWRPLPEPPAALAQPDPLTETSDHD